MRIFLLTQETWKNYLFDVPFPQPIKKYHVSERIEVLIVLVYLLGEITTKWRSGPLDRETYQHKLLEASLGMGDEVAFKLRM